MQVIINEKVFDFTEEQEQKLTDMVSKLPSEPKMMESIIKNQDNEIGFNGIVCKDLVKEYRVDGPAVLLYNGNELIDCFWDEKQSVRQWILNLK